MRITLVCWNLGKISMILSGTMLLPIIWSLVKGENCLFPLLFTFFLTLAIAISLMVVFRKSRTQTLRHREGFALVTIGWLLAAFVGSLPYIWTGMIPDFAGAFFESMSGFTTTGATVLPVIEPYEEGMLMWRMLTHWLGGMGIVVLVVALSAHSKGSSNLFNAETPGSSHIERLTPKISQTSLIMWSTYLALTVILIVLLWAEGMSFFDAICHAFSTVATGGFSTKTASMGAFESPLIQWTIILFMFICGANIAYMYFLVVKKKNLYFKQEEFKVYVYIIAIATIIVLFILLSNHIYPNGTFEYYLRTALFQVVAIITTTGFITDDFSYWPMMAKVILFLLFFAGGCFGSTTGSIKIPRWIITIKNAFKQLFATVHPRGVISVRLNNRLVPDNSIASTINYMIMFVSLIMIGGVLVCITGVPFYDAMCASVSCITNMGPSFGSLGSAGCYVILPAAAKIILSILMLIGRLEVYTFFVLLLPSVWRK